MTLTETALITKKIILGGGLTLVILIVGFIGYNFYEAYYLSTLPKPVEKPDAKFGLLPKLALPDPVVSTTNYFYRVDTTTGGFPTFDPLIKVYFMPKPTLTLLSDEKGRKLAQSFNFKSEPNILSDSVYQYTEDLKSLNLNIDTGNFLYKKETSSVARENFLPDSNQVVVDFKNFLASRGILPSQLSSGPNKVQFLKFEGDELVEVGQNAAAQAARVSLWPQAIDEKPIFHPDFNKAITNAIVIKAANDPENYVTFDYTFWPIDTASSGTYPIKTPDAALEDLKAGKGVIMVTPLKPEVSITSAYMAYYQPKTYTPYLQPIYVFEGPQFVSIVPAIDDAYVDQN